MPNIAFEIVVILLLLLANGYLALSEIAVVSARRPRLLQRAERGEAAAALAAELSRSPTKLLSTVQIGITLIGILSGAYGGATIAEELAAFLKGYPAIAPYSEGAAVAVVVIAISYLSVIIGELVPKRIALSSPERFAALVARPMTRLSRIAAPAVAALEYTSDFIMRVCRLPRGGDASVTEADVAAMVAAGTAAGVFEPAERRMVERVFRLGDEPAAAIMTPRRDIVWLDINDPSDAHRGERAFRGARGTTRCRRDRRNSDRQRPSDPTVPNATMRTCGWHQPASVTSATPAPARPPRSAR